MFPSGYFPPRYFAPRYWPRNGGGTDVDPGEAVLGQDPGRAVRGPVPGRHVPDGGGAGRTIVGEVSGRVV